MDGIHRKGTLDAHHRADARIACLEFHGRQAVGGGGSARAPVPVKVHSEQAGLTEGGHQLPGGNVAFLPPHRDLRTHDVVHDPAGDVADGPLFLIEHVLDVDQVQRMHECLLCLKAD